MFVKLCLTAIVGIAFAADLQQETKNAVNEVTTTKDGDLFCPVPIVGTRCPDSSVFHYYKCCGDLNKDCCFNLQTWVIVVLAVIAEGKSQWQDPSCSTSASTPLRCLLTDLEYADDNVALAESSSKLQLVANHVSKLVAAYGLRLRPDKCKQMWISSRPRTGIRVDGQPIE
ncbi:hypothetical protein RB195_008495 [Necator americanus]|uniref:WAP domain-containing protein n=1 Tax=Necator americanus TaxID=51031 RepID=A0ABR1CNY8_NECAM